jgi:hypothetical protein
MRIVDTVDIDFVQFEYEVEVVNFDHPTSVMIYIV